ncbi:MULTISPECIES: EAL domain-containing protein [Enterobacter]|uniref:EAL domain-containing protein n=1 Tax=Enterobacter TaxID=547 RepID=UPI001F26BD33|nr:EAL domain-containing protein [Enterobacter quasiroggenkampii]
MINTLKKAIREGEMKPWIQPIYACDGKLAGGEILVRWTRPDKAVVPPLHFIRIIEENNLSAQLTDTLFQQTCDYFKEIKASLPDEFHFAFNISPSQLGTSELIAGCDRFLSVFGKKTRLVLELTERQKIQHNDDDVIHKLRGKGIMVALDDFGTGYSSLDYLSRFDVDFIKIDKSFIDNICVERRARNVVKNMGALAKNLNIRTIAEGIETQEQLNELNALNIPFYQGYFCSRPLTLPDFHQAYL